MTGTRLSVFTSVRRAPRRRWTAILRYVSIGLVAFATLLAASGLALWRYAASRIDRLDIPSIVERPSPAPDDPPPIIGTLNVLVVGTDSRDGLTPEELQELGTEEVDGERPDTLMPIQMTPVRDEAVIVSFPRDLKVDIPGEGTGKINSVLGIGGPTLLVETVEAYSGIQLDHYVQVDIAGFLRLVDIVGGVPICLEEPLVDPQAGADIAAGCHTLVGRDAAGYVRARYTDPRGDIGRIERQQTFVKAAMARVTSLRTLFDPLRLKRLIDAVGASVTTDKGLGPLTMWQLARGLRSIEADDVDTRVVPSYWQSPYMHAHVEQAEALFQALREGTRLPDVGLTTPQELQPEDVRIAVLNGAGRSGLAAEVRSYLEARGFTVVSTGNAETFDLPRTELSFAPEQRPKARYLREFLPAGVEPSIGPSATVPAGADLMLVVGTDWAAPVGTPTP